jgi:hypothetical protein
MLCAALAGRNRGAVCLLLLLLALAAGPRGLAQGRNLPGATLISVQGEVRLKRAGGAMAPAAAPAPLSRRDEIETGAGTAEVGLPSGMVLRLGAHTLVAIILSPDTGVDAYFARGEIATRPGADGQLHGVHVVCGAGRMTLRGVTRVHGDATAATIEVLEGGAHVWGRGAVTLKAGHTTQLRKGSPPTRPAPIPTGPSGIAQDILHLRGDLPLPLALRWEGPVRRYQVELTRTDEPGPATVIETDGPSAEIRDLPVGLYAARVLPERGGGDAPARRVIVVRIPGLSPAGVLTLRPGRLPRIFTPRGLAAVLQLGGERFPTSGLPAGTHRVRLLIAGLEKELTVEVVQEAAVVKAVPAIPSPPAPLPRSPSAPNRDRKGTRGPSIARPPDLLPLAVAPVEDVLLGPMEVPGVRSPWARRIVQVRLDSTIQGVARIGVHGRLNLPSGFGGELGLAAVLDPRSEPGLVARYDLTPGLRSPALRRGPVGLQGVVSAVLPLFASVPTGSPTPERVFRVEAAVLLGLRLGRLALVIDQGAALRVSGQVAPAYIGGVAFQADVHRSLRLIGLCHFAANYLSDLPDGATNAGGAVGGGLEIFVPARLGGARILALGRTGIGAGGRALYGQGAFGLLAGYVFR